MGDLMGISVFITKTVFMSIQDNKAPNRKKQQSSTERVEQKADEPISDKVVIADECGDSLWNDVLAQQPDLSEIIRKSGTVDAEKEAGDRQ